MSLIVVAIPELNVKPLTYESPVSLKPGARVIVQVGKFFYTGFILKEIESQNIALNRIKSISAIIDDEFISDYDLWQMSVWTGKTCMCGVGRVLRTILPNPIITGEKVEIPPRFRNESKFHETNYFNPFDNERVNFYVEELKQNKRTLILFPKKESARKFFDSLPDNLKSESFLWDSIIGKKLWQSWNLVNAKKFRIVIGSQGAVFAPLSPEKIIVENEASPAYIFHKTPRISARTLAGIRAFYSGAEFIVAGNLPSLKTFMRSKPVEHIFPERKNIILADIFTSKEAAEHGIKGKIRLTLSLLKRTKRELNLGNNVLWIFDRLGESSEVFCENCGRSIKCDICGHVMRSETDGNILKCKNCGHLRNLPEKCENCDYGFFSGKSPGVEAIERIAKRFFGDSVLRYPFGKGSNFHIQNKLIISTQRGLELCEKIKISLIAWLDLDFELSGSEYNTRFRVFNMLWDSYWNGREKDSERKILIQARSSGMKLANFLIKGWSGFFPDELREREEYNLPPYGFNLELECTDEIIRKKIIDVFENSGIFVMDPGENSMPLTINENSTDKLAKIFDENFSNTEKKFIKITLKSE